MKIKPACAVVAALALAVIPSSTALAHDGNHPFENCPDAYENGASNIPEGDPHYGDHLDRDQDGIGCDKPGKDFVEKDWKHDDKPEESKPTKDEKPGDKGEKELAETGGDDTTGYIAAGGGALLLAGAGTVLITRKRRATR